MSTANPPHPNTKSSLANAPPPIVGAPTPAAAAPVAAGIQDTGRPNYIVPPSFARKPPPGVTYTPFQPMNLEATGMYLNKGFPLKPPLSDSDPHPFAARDVQQEDWLRFVGDIVTVGQITPDEDTMSAACWCCLAGLLGVAIRHHIRKKIKKDKAVVVCGMIDLWNEHFFHPRQMEVFLARGQQRHGDSKSPVPGLLRIRPDQRAAPPATDDNAKSKEDGDQVRGSKSSLVQISDGNKTYRLFVVSL